MKVPVRGVHYFGPGSGDDLEGSVGGVVAFLATLLRPGGRRERRSRGPVPGLRLPVTRSRLKALPFPVLMSLV